ncbi:MAG: LD-carboxypeptidase [Proteobacteria bacterium]|nr:LD-carboxypeptidase [Cystobacterineae bacterium]MCL2314990.1 LD-carboxypeptidase [Pseudomonadota bacterium]
MSLLCPKPLCPGDAVAVVAPAGVVASTPYEEGMKFLQQHYSARWGRGLLSQAGYLAGSDERRLEELQMAIDDEDIKAIFAARGGYGTMRLLPKLQLQGRSPKWLVGFSDITALHGLWQRTGWQSLHGPVVTQMGALGPEDLQSMLDTLERGSGNSRLLGTHCLVPGTASGPLLGGNLSVLCHLVGTPYMPDMRGAILLLEDIGEAPYRIDRMWTHLRLAGVFKHLSGIVLGSFLECEEKRGDNTCLKLLGSLASETGLPCVAGFPIGHGTRNVAVCLGSQVRLSAGSLRLTCLHGET